MDLSTQTALLILSIVSVALGINAVLRSWLSPKAKAAFFAAVLLLPFVGAAAALIMLDPKNRPSPSRLDEQMRDELDRSRSDDEGR